MSGFTSGLSYAWSSVNRLARLASERGVLGSERLPCRVISVGNIQAGGTGKTPLVSLIAREADARGLLVCVLTRGYRSRWESEGGVISPDDRSVDPVAAGDEATLLHELNPTIWIAVGRDRIRGFHAAQRMAGRPFDLAILDDGFQNWKIKKDVEIVAMTSDPPTQSIFRDFTDALSRADLVVWTKGDARPECAGRPLVKVRWKIERMLETGSKVEPDRPLHLVTGIASARHARRAIEEAGFRVVEHLCLADHADYSRERVQRILDEAKSRSLAVATTGKDWVKWRALGIAPEQVLVFEPRAEFGDGMEGRELWRKTLWG